MDTAEVEKTETTKVDITLRNAGPIDELHIPCPAEGGLVLITGANGRGKSKALEGINMILGGKGDVTVRDGELRGSIEGFGVKITLGKADRRTGECEVESLEGRYDVSLFVSGGHMKDAEAADAVRAKSLCRLLGIKPSIDPFLHLVGDRAAWDRVIQPREETDDITKFASGIKRDLEKAARNEESQADAADGHAKASAESIAGVDFEVEHRKEVLQEALSDATLKQDRLQQDAKRHAEQQTKMQEARAALEKANNQYDGSTVEAAQKSLEACNNLLRIADETVAEIETKLMAAKNDRIRALNARQNAFQAKRSAELHFNTIATFKVELDKAELPTVPGHELADAATAVETARAAVERGVNIRNAVASRDRLNQHREIAKNHRKQAKQYRSAAKSIDGVLNELLVSSGCPLVFGDCRLAVRVGDRLKYVADLSHGERCKLAIDLALPAVGPGGRIVAQQECIDALDSFALRDVHKHARKRRIVLYGAKVSDGDHVEAEEFEPSTSPAV